MIDSGSQINGVNEQFYKTYLLNQPNILILPVTNVVLRLANGSKSKRIGPRIQIEVVFNGTRVPFECFVIPNLISTLMIGNEFSFMHKNRLLWDDRVYQFTYNNTLIRCPFAIDTSHGVNFVTGEVQEVSDILKDKLS